MRYELSRDDFDYIIDALKMGLQTGVVSVEATQKIEMLRERFELADRAYLEIPE